MLKQFKGSKCVVQNVVEVSLVVDSRQAEDGNTIRRLRLKNAIIFTTYLNEWKKSGPSGCQRMGREQFSRDKIFNGIIRSAQSGLFLVTKSKRYASRIDRFAVKW